MATPIKADIIYYSSASDFELEFNLCGCCTMRLLSDKPKDKASFLRSLGRAVSRSQLIFAVGTAEGENAILPDLCSAIGYPLVSTDLSHLGVEGERMLPADAIPLVSSDGRLGGCVIQCGPQVIIVLTDDRDLRRVICKELVHDYVRELASTIHGAQNAPEENKSDESPKGSTVMDDDFVLEKSEEVTDFSELEEEILNEEKPKKPKKALKRLLTLFICLMFIGLGLVAYMLFAEPLVIKKLYKDYTLMYGSTQNSEDNVLDSIGALHEYNADTVGYIKIDGTDIDMPIVTEINKGSGYYEKHLYNGWFSYLYGTPFVKGDITSQTYCRNIVIYGKNARGGVMFSGLEEIATLAGYRSSPVISFDTLYSSDKYKIFAAFTCDGKADDEILSTSFADDNAFSDHLNKLLALSNIKTTVDVLPGDEIITLVAYGKDDVVIVARRLRAGESELVDTQNATLSDGSMKVGSYKPSGHNLAAQPMGTINPELFSQSYEQTAPLSPQQILAYGEAYKKAPVSEDAVSSGEVSSAVSSGASSDTAATVLNAENAFSIAGSKIITVYDVNTKQKVVGTTYDILCRMVEAEMGSTYEKEALKAQAVASYGWLLTSGAETDGAPKVQLKTASSTVCDAVKEVIGLKPYYQDTVAHTMYFPCSAGYTASADTLYATALPYLAPADSSVDRNNISYTVHRTYAAEDVRKWILEETGINLASVSDKTRWFNVTYDYTGSYAECVWFGNSSNIYSGRFLRECIFTVARVKENTLASAAYRITYQSESDTFLFEVRGQGHGLGMSQYGANKLAKAGHDFEYILSHYYKGISVSY
ncbi:MAG: SpoIID/LytB domain-containing protein [Clostridia bacterium]|nr:SpoIID/LytB domain-containing protein [Clostridia bacterium]